MVSQSSSSVNTTATITAAVPKHKDDLGADQADDGATKGAGARRAGGSGGAATGGRRNNAGRGGGSSGGRGVHPAMLESEFLAAAGQAGGHVEDPVVSLSLEEVPYDRDLRWCNTASDMRRRPTMDVSGGVFGRLGAAITLDTTDYDRLDRHYQVMVHALADRFCMSCCCIETCPSLAVRKAVLW